MNLWFFLAMLGLVGCDFSSPETQTIVNSCASASDCSAGTCGDGICIDDSRASLEVAVEVLRGSSDPERVIPASWAFAAESVSSGTVRDLDLPATREVRGLVRWADARVPATLSFVPRMQPGVASIAPVEVDVETFRDEASADGEQVHDFSVLLVAGESYDLVVTPSNDLVLNPTDGAAPAIRSLPPLYLEVQVESGATTEPMRFDIAFPTNLSTACNALQNTSCTFDGQVLSVDADLEMEEPEAGLQVRAIDETSGRVVSSIAETDELGHFEIRIGETTSSYLIRITSSVGRDPFPSVSVNPTLAFPNNPLQNRIYIPRLDPIQFTGRVRDRDETPVSNATVRFLSTGIFAGTALGLDGSFSASATTDGEGRFGVPLLPGFYAITVTPPDDGKSSWGVLTAEALVGEDVTTTEALIVPEQIGFRGWVATFLDEPAAGVTILARARPSAEAGLVNRSQETVTNELGAFAMTLDTGLYDVHVKVSAETGFAWFVEPELLLSADDGERTRGYLLEPPIPLQGLVRTSDGASVANAVVRAHILRYGEDGTTRSIQVAETVSGEDGTYRLLIAPRLGAE